MREKVETIFFIFAILIFFIFIMTMPAHADVVDMGGMTQPDYCKYIAELGALCGLVFCLGLNQ